MIDFEIREGVGVVRPDQIAELYEKSGFGNFSFFLKEGKMDFLFGPNIYWFYAIERETEELLGALRVFSDNIIITYIAEISVMPQNRSSGIGDELMDYAGKKFSHTAFFCCAFRGMERFLSAHGLKEKDKLFACSKKAVSKGENVRRDH